ncbi:site-2 protease family protein [Spiroplasma tabanidicola]|uniref:Inner membrane zinc metalloprotease n=1 Tax=Spiroplasma tabanidicola TaxID=324079 RepID=A0A6I6CDR1_9MOLU|nr:site-2 protease family protein [Spiroplasma tabanidicola]QGS52114.1 inner membrane zinc metalloprotease [Spiroplasma tabanidicola]
MSTGMFLLGFAIGIISVLVLITLHELGHCLVAKLSGAYVYEFAIGFGPRILTIKGKETWVTIRAFPLGGFCSIASDKVDPPSYREDVEVPKERQMDYIKRWKKLLFLIFGPLMNLFIAIFIFTTIFAVTKAKTDDMSYFGQKFQTDAVAEKLITDKERKDLNDETIVIDQSYAIWGWKLINKQEDKEEVLFNNIDDSNPDLNCPKINEADSLKAANYSTIVYNFIDNLTKLKNENDLDNKEDLHIMFSYKKVDKYTGFALNGYQQIKTTDYSTTEMYSKTQLAVGIMAPTRYYSSGGKAYLAGWEETFKQSFSILKSFGSIFTKGFKNLAGPVGIATQTANMMGTPRTFFTYIAMLSANLFVLNMLIIPPLDGYKTVELLIEMIMRKDLSKKYKIWVYSTGAVLMLALFIGVTLMDLFR